MGSGRWWRVAVVGAILASCSGSDGGSAGGGPASAGPRWRCFLNPTPQGIYCECRDVPAGDPREADFTAQSCPASNYKCCEARSAAESYDGKPSCICWNPETVPGCDGRVPIVDSCPSTAPSAPGPTPGQNVGWCCATSGGVCLCRNDQPLPCTTGASCAPIHRCCIAGNDSDGRHCACYTDGYLSQVQLTCQQRADPSETLVTSCPN